MQIECSVRTHDHALFYIPHDHSLDVCAFIKIIYYTLGDGRGAAIDNYWPDI